VKEHILQLFDTTDSLANVVSAYLNEGWQAGDHLLVTAKPSHWTRISERLERRSCPVTLAIKQGRLTVLDAATTLARMSRSGFVDRQLFLEHIGALVGRLVAETAHSVRVYTETVELVAEEGDLSGAHHLEQLWNELVDRQRFSLLCGYSAAHFADLRTSADLHAICTAHTRVQKNTSDMLGSWLVGRDRPAS
jgi:hypothetical protein